MAFEFMKKGLNKLKNATVSDKQPKETPKKVEGKDFASQEEALKPKDAGQKKGGGIMGALSNIRDNLDKSALGKAFGTPGWYKAQWETVEEAANMIPNSESGMKFVLAQHREAFRAFCVNEYSVENLNLYEAIVEGKVAGVDISKKEVYETYLAVNAPKEANFPQNLLQALHDLAQKGEFDKMDFSKLKGTATTNLTDPFYRFNCSDDLKRTLFFKLTGVKSPNKVGGVKGE